MEYEFESDKSLLMALYGMFFLLAIILVYFAVEKFRKTSLLLSVARPAKAKVVEIITLEDGDGRSFRPVFEFSNDSGEVFRFEHDISSNPLVWKKGEVVSIVYDPTNPNNARVVSFWALYRWSIILCMIAAPLFVVSVGYFLFLMFIK